MSNNFTNLLHALDIGAQGESGVINLEAAQTLENFNVWFPGALLAESAANPFASLQALVIDPFREESLTPEEFEVLTGLDRKYMYNNQKLDDLPPQEVFAALGKLTWCWLAAARNQVRAQVLEPAGLSGVADREDAAGAADAWAARAAAAAAARPARSKGDAVRVAQAA
jgi:hypothetical protein